MILRLIEVVVPCEAEERVAQLVEDGPLAGAWTERLSDGQCLVRMLMEARHTEAMVDPLGRQFSGVEGFRVIILPVEASLPRPDVPEEEPAESKKPLGGMRISRE
jgi:hypothetical protein